MFRKLVLFSFLLAVAVSLHAASKVMLGTDGPDLYQDGTPVLEGERYGVVYVYAGKTFDGFTADGSLVNATDNKLLPFPKYAQAGHNLGMIGYPSKNFPSFTSGSLYLVVFDTRTPSGELGGLTNGWGVVGYAKFNSSTPQSNDPVLTYVNTDNTRKFAVVTDSAGLPSPAPGAPQIEKIDVTETEVVLTVGQTSPFAYYIISASEELGASAEFVKQPRSTAVLGSAEGTIVLRYPRTSGGRFFKVIGGALMDL